MSNAPVLSDHSIETFLRVQSDLDYLYDGMQIETQKPLSKALERLSCLPFVSFPFPDLDWIKFSVADEEAGTFGKPNKDVILRHSAPSSFGKGEKTVMDETYRRGQEILGADVKFKYTSYIEPRLQEILSATLFVGRRVVVKLYKLAVYKEGGHFDWHMDSTHSDQHHATVLLALNTSWTGGDLILRQNGVETRFDMKPKVTPRDDVTLGCIAFYTDTEHRVEPITEGERIVFQYDVEVKNWKKKKVERKDKTEGDSDEQGEDDDDEDSDHMDVDDNYQSVLREVEDRYELRRDHQRSSTIGDAVIVDEIVAIIGRLLQSGEDEVGFAMQYLYRKSSILPEFLKGSDSLLYQTLIKTFDVSLHPIVLHEKTDYEGRYGSDPSNFQAFKFDDDESGDNEDLVDDKPSSISDIEPTKPKKPTIFYMPRASALKQISREEYIEHTGNEAQPGSNKYFGGGMFVRRKNT